MNTKNKTGWVFLLFVSGKNQKTDRSVALLKEICEEHLDGACDIRVIDVIQDPLAGMEENIIATPTLLKKFPGPVRRFIGDFSNKETLLSGLEIIA